MAIRNIEQPNIIIIDNELRLRKAREEEWKVALPWYENPKVLYYSEGLIQGIYDMEIVNRMYGYLSSIGELYFIEILEKDTWIPIGDITLSEKNMPIIIGDEKYWGRGIGKKSVLALIDRAKSIKLDKIQIPTIYKYNERSKNLFISIGFIKVKEDENSEFYELKL